VVSRSFEYLEAGTLWQVRFPVREQRHELLRQIEVSDGIIDKSSEKLKLKLPQICASVHFWSNVRSGLGRIARRMGLTEWLGRMAEILLQFHV
jgi:hypothetical protein